MGRRVRNFANRFAPHSLTHQVLTDETDILSLDSQGREEVAATIINKMSDYKSLPEQDCEGQARNVSQALLDPVFDFISDIDPQKEAFRAYLTMETERSLYPTYPQRRIIA